MTDKYELKNAVRVSQDGDYIDCEWNHPVYGWIPFTAYKFDVVPYGREIWAILDADPNTLPYTDPTPDPQP